MLQTYQISKQMVDLGCSHHWNEHCRSDLFFGCALQSLYLGLSCFFDKFNLIIMNMVLFMMIFYSVSFYSLVYARDSRKCSKNLIIYEKNNMKSYFFEPFLFLVRGSIKSFVHGYFIYSYSTQIVLLLVVDLIFLILCFSMMFLVTSYLLGFTLFDLYFVL